MIIGEILGKILLKIILYHLVPKTRDITLYSRLRTYNVCTLVDMANAIHDCNEIAKITGQKPIPNKNINIKINTRDGTILIKLVKFMKNKSNLLKYPQIKPRTIPTITWIAITAKTNKNVVLAPTHISVK